MAEKNQTEELNKLCLKCIRPCKQGLNIVMLECPRYQQRPFKSEQHRFQQLDLFGKSQDKLS